MKLRVSLIALTLLASLGIAGTHFLTAQETPSARGARATPKQIRDAQGERVNLTATAPHTMGRITRDLRTLAAELEAAGHRDQANRLKSIIAEIVRRAEHDLAERKADLARIKQEMDELKAVLEE